MKTIFGALALGMGGLGAAAQGQVSAPASDKPIPAPRIGTAPAGNPIWAQLLIRATGDWHAWDDGAAPFREAEPIGTARAWFPAAHPAIKAFLADPAQPFSASAKLRLTTGGAIAACTFERPPQAPLTPEQLCDAVKRSIRFRPALGQDRKPAESDASLLIDKLENRWGNGETPPGLIESQLFAPPAPPPPPPPPKLTKFPPDAAWVARYVGPAKFRQAPLAGPAPLDAPLAGVVIGSKASPLPGCSLVAPSGDSVLDAAACRIAEKQLKPTWPSDTPERAQTAALLVGGTAKAPTAWAADAKAGRRVQIAEGKAADLYRAVIAAVGPQPDDAWEAFAMVAQIDSQGRVTGCRISRSGGSDRGDIEACRILSEGDWLMPATDVFGRPQANGFFYWSAPEQKRRSGT